LKGLVDISRELASLTGNDDQKVSAFWTRTTDEFSKAITEKNIFTYNKTDHPDNQQYPDKITPQELRFPGIKAKILEIYDTEEDELCKEFMYKVDGKLKVNSDWIKIDREIDEEEFGKEDVKFLQSIRENGGYKITIRSYTAEERKKGKVDTELPLSNIFRAAQWVDQKKICLNPRYPFLFFFYMMNLFKFSVPKERISPNIQNIIDDLWDRRETLLEKSKTKINSAMKSVENGVSKFVGEHRDTFGAISSQINLGLDSLDDDKIDQVVSECDKAIDMFTSNSEKDLAQVISGLMNADESKVRETMDKFGFSGDNIKNIIDNASGGISNDDLKATIPSMDDMDSLLAQINGIA
jgi:hypothetical protein